MASRRRVGLKLLSKRSDARDGSDPSPSSSAELAWRKVDMQYCRHGTDISTTPSGPPQEKARWFPLETVRSVIPSLPRDDRCAAVDIDANLGVGARFFRDHTAVIAKLCCEADQPRPQKTPAPAEPSFRHHAPVPRPVAPAEVQPGFANDEFTRPLPRCIRPSRQRSNPTATWSSRLRLQLCHPAHFGDSDVHSFGMRAGRFNCRAPRARDAAVARHSA